MKEKLTLKKEYWKLRSTSKNTYPDKEFFYKIKCNDKYIIDRILCIDKYYKNSLQYNIVLNDFCTIFMWEKPKHDIEIMVYLKRKY